MTLQEKERLYFEFEQARKGNKFATALRIIGQMPEPLASGARKKMDLCKKLDRVMAEHSLEEANSYEDFPEDYGLKEYDVILEQMPLEPGFFTDIAGDRGSSRDAALAIAEDKDDIIIAGLYGQDWRSLPPNILKESSDRLLHMKIAAHERERRPHP